METASRYDPATEVRRCARCGQPTLFCVRAWHHRFAGIDTPNRTLDLQCQTCGAKVTLHPQSEIAAERLIAFLLLPAVFPSVYFFASARGKARAWTDNPVVAGRRHAPAGPRDRWCACTGAASCFRIVQRRSGGLAIGTRYEFRCAACGRAFTVPDTASLVASFLGGGFLCALGGLMVAFPPGSDVGAEESNQWFGAALVAFGVLAWVLFALGLRARVNHPEVD